jgi:hypothetical protein
MFNNLVNIKNFIPREPFLSNKMWFFKACFESNVKVTTTIDNNPKMHVKLKMVLKKKLKMGLNNVI